MIPDKVRAVLEEHYLTVLELGPGSCQPPATAARRIGVAVAQIARSILLKAETNRYYLVICPGDKLICAQKARLATGSVVRMAHEAETGLVTGFKPGGICPFGLQGVDILLDWNLAKHETIYPTAGSSGALVAMNFSQLQTITGARVVDIMLDED